MDKAFKNKHGRFRADGVAALHYGPGAESGAADPGRVSPPFGEGRRFGVPPPPPLPPIESGAPAAASSHDGAALADARATDGVVATDEAADEAAPAGGAAAPARLPPAAPPVASVAVSSFDGNEDEGDEVSLV